MAVPTVESTAAHTPEPTVSPTAEPTTAPTVEPTPEPTQEPTAVPTVEPTVEQTPETTASPAAEPTTVPTVELILEPTPVPTLVPTEEPAVEGSTFETAIEIREDRTVRGSITPESKMLYYIFSPGLSGNYTFTFSGTLPIKAVLYDKNRHQLTVFILDPQGNDSQNIVCTYSLKTAQKYYLRSKVRLEPDRYIAVCCSKKQK
jgi:hypothetical protein